MKLLPLLWLLCGLLLVVGDQDPPVASSPKAPIAGNVTVSTLGNATSAAAGATGTPIAADTAQTNQQSPPKATKIEQQPKEAEKTPAVPENVGKNRKRTDTDNPKPAGNATVIASTPKPAGVETKASTAAATSAATPAPAPAPSSKSVSPTAAKTATTNTAKPTPGSAIVSEGQSMKDVTKANNATSHQPGSSNNNTIIISTSTTAPTKTTSKTTPKPTKPPVVFSMDTHTEWEEGKAGDKPPLPKPVSTLAEPVTPQVQELTDRGDTSYVVPIVTVLLTVPLAIGVVTIMYRRFRDMWSTRHYRRMDFLVDGMYND